jgi:hypothetical protein
LWVLRWWSNHSDKHMIILTNTCKIAHKLIRHSPIRQFYLCFIHAYSKHLRLPIQVMLYSYFLCDCATYVTKLVQTPLSAILWCTQTKAIHCYNVNMMKPNQEEIMDGFKFFDTQFVPHENGEPRLSPYRIRSSKACVKCRFSCRYTIPSVYASNKTITSLGFIK